MGTGTKNIKLSYEMVVTKNFYDNIKHLLFINQIIGLFPVSVTKSNDCYKLQWSWLKVVIGNFLVLLFACLMISGLLTSYKTPEVYNVRVKDLGALIVTLTEILALSSTWIIGQVSLSILFKDFWVYLFYLNKFDNLLGLIEPTKKIPITILIVFLFTFTCLGMDIYMWAHMVVPVIGPLNFLWQIVPFYFTYVFTMILEINIWITLRGITARVRRLNNLVNSYVLVSHEFNEAQTTNYSNIRNKNLRGVLFNSKDKSILQCSMLSSNMIKSFIKAFGYIAQANISINKFYGPSMLILMVNVISCLVITPYVLYQQILNAKENKFLFTQSYWMTCHVLRLLFLIEPCHAGQVQGEEFKKTVIKLLGLELQKESFKQAKILLQSVKENNTGFNATGMTFINRTLLPTIASAVFTYLAILFQYNTKS